MSFFATGNRPVNSTGAALASNPDTATLLAEIDFNGSNASSQHSGGRVYGVTWILGCQTTLVTFQCDQANSTALAVSSAAERTFFVEVSSGQSAQFFTKHEIQPGQRLRARLATAITGVANAFISAEPLD